MEYRIGYPVDAGVPDLSFMVLVQLCQAPEHFCSEGKSSGLRENSGAAFVFSRVSHDIQTRYRFEFTPVPMPNSKTSPNTIAHTGFSDAVACALAVKNYRPERISENAPLLLVSCAFALDHKILDKLMLEKVTGNNFEEAKQSLLNKWQTAQKNQAKVLILHEQDAQLLKDVADIYPLQKQTIQGILRKNLDHCVVVSCKSQQWSTLQKNLCPKKSVALIHYVGLLLLLVGLWSGWQFYLTPRTTKSGNAKVPTRQQNTEIVTEKKTQINVQQLPDYTISKIPQTIAEFRQMYQEAATTPQGAATMMILALWLLSQEPELGESAVITVIEPRYLLQGKLSKIERKKLHNRVSKNMMQSYFKGTSSHENYHAELPFTVQSFSNRHSRQENNRYKIFIHCNGADTPRPVTLTEQEGIWQVSEWSSLTWGIRER